MENLQQWRISLFPGGIGFSFYNYSNEKALRVKLTAVREDGITEDYLSNAYYCGEWGGGWQKWQTHRLPLFPYESLHGRITHMIFSYSVLKDDTVIPSRYHYRFATLEDFHKGWVSPDDFHDPCFKTENGELPTWSEGNLFQHAYERLNGEERRNVFIPLFTRGDTWRQEHPVSAIHEAIDTVIARKEEDPAGHHSIHLAMFDFDHDHVTRHLVYAHEKGVEVECIGDWAQVSPMNTSEHIARLRRARIPVYGVVRNDPCRRHDDIASMHTKFIIFDDQVTQSGSYNLHFHLWGGNWESGIAYRSADASSLHRSIYKAIRNGHPVKLAVDPERAYNLYYSFGTYRAGDRIVRPQDAIVTAINDARQSIVVCMFDCSPITGIDLRSHEETDVIEALIRARDRGVWVRVIVNGMIAHCGHLPEPWDKDFKRPLKAPLERLRNAWIEVFYVYYWESIYSPLHHKFAVIDDRTVLTGSYNWYEPSLYSDELLAVIRDEKVADAFQEEAEFMLRTFRIERG